MFKIDVFETDHRLQGYIYRDLVTYCSKCLRVLSKYKSPWRYCPWCGEYGGDDYIQRYNDLLPGGTKKVNI